MTSFWLDTHPPRTRGTPMAAGRHYDAAVVGAGLTGLVAALLLARAGVRTCLLEARFVGAVATGNTTAKVSLLQGSVLSEIRDRHGDEVLAAYVAANRAGQEWLVGTAVSLGVDVQHRAAYTYAVTPEGRPTLEAELAASTAAGLSADWTSEPGLPFPVLGAVALADQAQVHPVELLDALAESFVDAGGALHIGRRVRDVDASRYCRVHTSTGDIVADHVLLATGTPILDRGGHFARMTAERSYAVAARIPDGPVPQGMYLSVDEPARSLRTAPTDDGRVLLVGGNGHVVGRHPSPRERVDDLTAWTEKHFPGAVRTHAWSAQDYRPAASVPFVGPLAWSDGRVYVATGYHKWGMTNGVAAALHFVGALTGRQPEWADVLDGATAPASALGRSAAFTAEAMGSAASGWLHAELHPLPDEAPVEGTGVVGRRGAVPAGRSTVGGRTVTVSAVCPHLGGVLAWNDAECSWDCPLHGSRFDASGALLEGPAVSDLPVLS